MFHTIIIVGNLGTEPEMRYIASGQAVTKFNVASNRNYRNSEGQTVKETIWFRVTVWGKQAESVNNFLHKGSKVVIEGRLSPDPSTGNPRIWNRQDGSPAASFEVTASTVRFLSSRGEGGTGEEAGDVPETDTGDEIPF
ncbi:MAG TPA: single-stranded DNA-binding protein [Anaerolineaceae bacterium]|nr:single-stranded DNA-binding protein [Anaerolineaceae bacterium]HQN04760.1 single-stranded DNA-binding protein [Anaerolineaceae bacterium]HQP08074.1 single-stranded DNA-binding protein [Anaerolineaceae bacterium]